MAQLDQLIGALLRKRAEALELCHYIVQIGPSSGAPGRCIVRQDFAEKFGADFQVPSDESVELAEGRVLENFILP